MREPFVGPSGEFIDYMLDEIDLDRQSVYITNALKCHPPGNRKAMPGELGNCWREWLFSEITVVNPVVILLLGNDAHMAVLPPEKKFSHLVENKSKKRVYLTSYHPSWFLRRGDLEGFIAVGHKIRELLDREGSRDA